MLVFSAAPALAIAYTPGMDGWMEFTTSVEAPKPYGYGTWGGTVEFGPPDIYNQPYTFYLGAPGTLKITDIFETGDRFLVWDNDVTPYYLGTSATTWFYNPTGMTDPDLAYASGIYSRGTKMLAAGSHSLKFQNTFLAHGLPPDNDGMGHQPGGESQAYFRVDPIPEPGTMALLGLGLAFAGLVIRRKR
jgi:hypothetical protein